MDSLSSFLTVYLPIQHALSVLILILNGFLLVALVKKKALHTPSNAILGCLSCSDLLIGILSLPLWRLHSSIGLTSLAGVNDKLFIAISQVFFILTGLSSVFMMLVNLDRYAAICQPFRYLQQVTAKFYTAISVCTSLIYISVMAVAVVIDRMYHVHSGIWILMIIQFSIIFGLISCNWRIFRVIRRHRRSIASVARQFDPQQSEFQRETKRYHMIVLLIVLYVLFNLPSRISLVLIFISKTKVTNESFAFYMSSNVLLLLNSFFNPFVYCLRIRVFRDAIREVVCCKKAGNQNEFVS